MSVCVIQERAQVPSTLDLSHRGCHDNSDPECNSSREWSPDLQGDVDFMEQRSVTHSPHSPAFKAELEGVFGHLNKGSEFLTNITNLINSQSQNAVCFVNDLYQAGCYGYSGLERQNRCKLASLHRLLHLYGWSSLTHTHTTTRVSKGVDQLLTLPLGLSFSEATAASLVKVDLSGRVLDSGSSGQAVLGSELHLHTHIYSCRPEVRCVIHTHTPATAAVSSMKCGILPISHDALLLGEVSYFSLAGNYAEEREELQRALGPTAKVLVLGGHGVLALGETLEEAFHNIYHCQQACEIQVNALSSAGGVDKLLLLDRNKYKALSDTHTPSDTHTHTPSDTHTSLCEPDGQVSWRTGEAEFESLMRMLDSLGYRTGYTYRHPVVKELPRSRSAVEIPAAVTSRGPDIEAVFPWRPVEGLDRQQQDRTLWLTSPNSYLKLTVPQTSRTTWKRAEDSSSCRGTPIRIIHPNQFVPLNTNPSEVLQIRTKIREQHWVEVMTAGPQSQLLAGVPPDQKPGPAFIYEDELDEPLPPNPFSQSEADLEEYKSLVEQHQSQQDGDDATEAEEISTFEGSTLSLSLSPLYSPVKEEGTPPLADLEHDLSECIANLSVTMDLEVTIAEPTLQPPESDQLAPDAPTATSPTPPSATSPTPPSATPLTATTPTATPPMPPHPLPTNLKHPRRRRSSAPRPSSGGTRRKGEMANRKSETNS
ncbi:adducin 3 (gamma) b [Clupea harengus]|uniref:Adducin 3 (Gamma) b n=1 Tax=Clupea harengus TaxID=7950 RepID=A0A6P8G760_CLUHA|nr:adducin 3 (gamma) b [Clupea harengus]